METDRIGAPFIPGSCICPATTGPALCGRSPVRPLYSRPTAGAGNGVTAPPRLPPLPGRSVPAVPGRCEAPEPGRESNPLLLPPLTPPAARTEPEVGRDRSTVPSSLVLIVGPLFTTKVLIRPQKMKEKQTQCARVVQGSNTSGLRIIHEWFTAQTRVVYGSNTS